jgi:nucleoside-diphosphate-sugar epimerase
MQTLCLENTMAKVLIAGCGDLGGGLRQRLMALGHEVHGLKRNPATLPPGIRPVKADLLDPAGIALPPGVELVAYILTPDTPDEAGYRAAYVTALENLLGVLQHQSPLPRRLLLVSSTSVYAQGNGQWVDEDSPAEARRFSGRLIREGEELAWASAIPTVVIRFGGIYGSNRTRLLDTLRTGTARCVPGVYSNRIHRDDAVATLAHLLLLENPTPLYLGVDSAPSIQCEVLDWLAGKLGVAPPARVQEASETERAMRGNKRVSNRRLLASGFRFRYPSYREGYGEILRDYR